MTLGTILEKLESGAPPEAHGVYQDMILAALADLEPSKLRSIVGATGSRSSRESLESSEKAEAYLRSLYEKHLCLHLLHPKMSYQTYARKVRTEIVRRLNGKPKFKLDRQVIETSYWKRRHPSVPAKCLIQNAIDKEKLLAKGTLPQASKASLARPVKQGPCEACAPKKPKPTPIIWAVFNSSNQMVAEFDYPQRAEAEAHAAKLMADTKSTHFVCQDSIR